MGLRRKFVRSAKSKVLDWYARLANPFEGVDHTQLLSTKQVRDRKRLCRAIYAAVFALILAVLLHSREWRAEPLPSLRVGDAAARNIISPITIDLEIADEDFARTKDDLAKRIAPVFDYDQTVLTKWSDKWHAAIKQIRDEFYSESRPTPSVDDLPLKIRTRLDSYIGSKLPAGDLSFLLQHKFSDSVQHAVDELTRALTAKLIAADDLFPLYYSTGIMIRQVGHSPSQTMIYDVARIWSTEHAAEFLRQLASTLPGADKALNQRVAVILGRDLGPNIVLNEQLTQARIAVAVAKQSSQIQTLQRGTVIVPRGEQVSASKLNTIEALRAQLTPLAKTTRLATSFFLFWILLIVTMRIELSRRAWWQMSFKDACIFAACVIAGILTSRISLGLFSAGFRALSFPDGAQFLVPVAAGGIVTHLILGKEAATNYAILVALSLSLWMDQSLTYGVWCFLVTSAAIHRIRACKRRTDLYRSGIWSGVVGVMLVICFFIFQEQARISHDWVRLLIQSTSAFLAGIMSAVIAGAVIPVLEAMFGYTTNLKLLELSNFNHPLLHNLMINAPGTYHHSVIVGSLAEIAADKVKANGLLARVSAYYHDIGKMNNPMYFIENQTPAHNPHDALVPSMSAKILFSHVKLGVRLGKQYKLGSTINKIIEQHHGTTLISIFFDKAKNRTGNDQAVDETDFRYPGPKPQTREAAIVMLADACEAATRSIADPSPGKIQAMVRNIINKRFLDQQFNNCDLTMSDLSAIEESFTRTLVSLYHNRIEYPDQRQQLEADAYRSSQKLTVESKTIQ